jgi:hypothetical protein
MYHLQWLIEKRVIYGEMGGDISPQDIKDMADIYQKMIAESIPELHYVYCVHKLGKLPVNLRDVPKIFPKTPEGQNATGWNLLYGETNSVVKMTSMVAFHLMGGKYRWLNSHTECLSFLYEMDASLQGLPVNPIPGIHRQDG